MAQHFSKKEEEIYSLLKVYNKGWNIALFKDTERASLCLCTHCKSICCDAVELGCGHLKHDDDEISLYCRGCLHKLVMNNNNKCIIDGHDDPPIVAARSIRRQILKSIVVCPFSSQYKMRCNIIDDEQVIDTIGKDEKEGLGKNENTCHWEGEFKDLLNQHIAECAKQYDPSFGFKLKIRKLQNEHSNKLKQKDEFIRKLQVEIKDLKLQIQNLMTETKNDDDRDKKFKFVIPSNCRNKLTKLNKNILQHKGDGYLNTAWQWCRYGRILSGNDKVTVHFETSNAGSKGNYGFGLRTPGWAAWNSPHPSHSISIRGNGSAIINDEFADINDNKIIIPQIANMKIMNMSRIKNVIIMSVDMKEKKGWIWNEYDEDNKVEVKLPKKIVMIIMICGSDDKTVTVTKVVK